MSITKRGPGRPRKPDALDAAARMRASRDRKRRAGFVLQQTWVAAASVYSDHQRLDARSLALHCLIARKILANPALLTDVKRTLARFKAQVQGPVPEYFGQWERILLRNPQDIAAFLAGMNPEAVRLRQSSPFTRLLTPAERARVYKAFK